MITLEAVAGRAARSRTPRRPSPAREPGRFGRARRDQTACPDSRAPKVATGIDLVHAGHHPADRSAPLAPGPPNAGNPGPVVRRDAAGKHDPPAGPPRTRRPIAILHPRRSQRSSNRHVPRRRPPRPASTPGASGGGPCAGGRVAAVGAPPPSAGPARRSAGGLFGTPVPTAGLAPDARSDTCDHAA